MKRFNVLMALLCLIPSLGASAWQGCPVSNLISPEVAKVYPFDGKERPVFQWETQSEFAVTYELEVYKGEEVIFSKELEGTVFSDVSELETTFDENSMSPVPYKWRVITSGAGQCESSTSSFSTFYVIATPPASVLSGGAEVDLIEIECRNPAFSSNGQINYKAKVDLKNLPGSFAAWDVQSYTIPSGTNAVTTLFDCLPPNSFQTSSPLPIAAGVTDTWCFDFSLPATTTSTHFTANGTMAGFPTIVTDISGLPECLCKVCDEWRFEPGGKSDLNYLPGQSPTFEIAQDFQITGAAPMKEMHADVISVLHKVDNEICQVCVKGATKMGTFPYQIIGNLPRDLVSGWQYSNAGRAGLDSDNDGYTSQLVWTATNQLTGIDFSTVSRKFRIPIALPDHALECCESTYEVCVRYTFTDINCKSCDVLICYELQL